jgi:hypothetical protein
MKRILMILTSHRLDCFRLAMDLLFAGGSIRRFDRVVLLLNGVAGRHLRYVRRLQANHPDIPWDVIAGPRGRGERISGLQNECVRRHPGNLYFKIDEDTFVSRDWDERLVEACTAHRDDPAHSLVTPVITNNAAGFHYLLQRFPGLKAEYDSLFSHPVTPVCDGTVWRYPQVAAWITRKLIDLDEANRRLRAGNTEPFVRFSYRFSINCLCYDYRHWQEIGGVPTDDELGWGEWIPAHGKYIVLATTALCHHYSFFVQNDWLDRTTLLEEIRRANLPGRFHSLAFHLPRLGRTLRQIPSALRRRLSKAN